MPFGNVRKQAAEYRTQKAGECIDQSAVLSDFHDTEPEGQYSGQSQRYLESGFRRVESWVHDSCKYLRITQKNYFYQGDNEGDNEECYPDII